MSTQSPLIHSEAAPADASWSRNSAPSVSVTERSLCQRVWAVFKAFFNSPLVNMGPSAALSFVAAASTESGKFEFTAMKRLMSRHNYDEIPVPGGAGGGRLFLGALPNKLSDDGAKLAKEGIQAVLSINEPWERQPVGTLSLPYSREEWGRVGVIGYGEIDVKDHTFLTPEQMNGAADFIHNQISQGRTVYVHCRAGQGRSSAAIAAYLIKYKDMSNEAICGLIEDARPKATIRKKIPSLHDFREHLDAARNAPFDAVFAAEYPPDVPFSGDVGE